MSEETPVVAPADELPSEVFSFKKLIFSGLKNFLFIVIGWLILNIFLQASLVVGGSMKNTLQEGDLLLGYRPWLGSVSRGDIVTVKKDKKLVVKRLAAVEGDHVEITPENGLLVNGIPFEVELQGSADEIYGEWDIGEGEIFIVGDNRADSSDSRFYGPIPKADITSRVFFRYFPLNKIGGL